MNQCCSRLENLHVEKEEEEEGREGGGQTSINVPRDIRRAFNFLDSHIKAQFATAGLLETRRAGFLEAGSTSSELQTKLCARCRRSTSALRGGVTALLATVADAGH